MKRDVSIIVLFDENKRILMQYRDNKAKRFALKWGFFGGGLKENEKPEEAIKREVFEEVSYELKNPVLIWKQEYTIKENNESGFEYIFKEKWDGTKLGLNESGSMEWKTIDEALLLDLNEVDQKVVKFLSENRLAT